MKLLNEKLVMTQEDKELLLRDISARLPYETKCIVTKSRTEEGQEGDAGKITYICLEGVECIGNEPFFSEFGNFKPYLIPLSSMTEEKAKELSILYGIKDILSINITDEYIDFKVDDGFCSFERKTIWYNEIISSTETFDWLNKNHFDYRGINEKGLAIDATGLNIY